MAIDWEKWEDVSSKDKSEIVDKIFKDLSISNIPRENISSLKKDIVKNGFCSSLKGGFYMKYQNDVEKLFDKAKMNKLIIEKPQQWEPEELGKVSTRHPSVQKTVNVEAHNLNHFQFTEISKRIENNKKALQQSYSELTNLLSKFAGEKKEPIVPEEFVSELKATLIRKEMLEDIKHGIADADNNVKKRMIKFDEKKKELAELNADIEAFEYEITAKQSKKAKKTIELEILKKQNEEIHNQMLELGIQPTEIEPLKQALSEYQKLRENDKTLDIEIANYRSAINEKKKELEELKQSISNINENIATLADNEKILSEQVSSLQQQKQDKENKLAEQLKPLKQEAAKAIEEAKNNKALNALFIKLTLELAENDSEFKNYQKIMSENVDRLNSEDQLNRVIKYKIDFKAKFDFYINGLNKDNLNTVQEIADLLGYEIIIPQKGDNFLPSQHSAIADEMINGIARGKVVRYEKLGYKDKNSQSVIQKAKIIISK